MKPRCSLVLLVLLILLSACASEPLPLEGEAATTTVNPVAPASTAPVLDVADTDGVRVAITGFLSPGQDGIAEVCPGTGGPCPGVLLLGGAPSLDDPSNMVRLIGLYDGRNIFVEEWDEVVPAETDFTNPCGLSATGFGNPPDGAFEAVDREVAGSRDRLAGMWWDSSNQVMTLWFTGDAVDDLRVQLEAAASGEMALCVVGGAMYSEQQLLQIQSDLDRFIDYRALGVQSTSTDIINNRVEVSSELLDEPTRLTLEAEFAGAVVVHAFIEVLNGLVADLPDPLPAIAGDVELVTQSTRAGDGMTALGRFVVMFDADRGCVYFPGDEESNNGEPGTGGRTLPVWPFGYTAQSDPLRIYDFDGNLLAAEGDTIEMGGGFVSAEFTDVENDCGATGAWIASSPPVVVTP